MGRYLQDPTTGRLNGAIGEGRDGAPRPLPATSCAPAGDQPAGSLTGALTTVTATRRRTQAQALAWMARYQSWAFGRQPGAAVSADADGTLWVSDTFRLHRLPTDIADRFDITLPGAYATWKSKAPTRDVAANLPPVDVVTALVTVPATSSPCSAKPKPSARPGWPQPLTPTGRRGTKWRLG